MPSKLKKAIAVVKDQTSISLAMVKTSRTHHNSASSLEVAILKATTHEDCPINPHRVSDILRIVTSNRTHASLCARSLGRRVGRTRNWTVALKSLVLALRLFQSGDPYFPKEVLHSVKSKSGHNLLDLSSSSFPRHFSAFVRSFAAYLHLRLRSLLSSTNNADPPSSVREMKPTMLLDRVPHWQRLLDKAVSMGMGPSGAAAARSSRLVQSSLHAVVQESFELYKDLSDGLAILLDAFFHLDYELCATALDACVKASRQFEDLAAFYDFCKSCGIGVVSEYPNVRKIPDELIDTLQEFLKDQSSFPATASSRRLPLSLIGSSSITKDSEPGEGRLYRSYDHDRSSDPGDDNLSPLGTNDLTSVRSEPDTGNHSGLDFLDHGEATMLQGTISGEKYDDESSEESSDCDETGRGWELALLETATQQPGTSKTNSDGGFGLDFLEENAASSLLSYPPSNQYNPFLQDTTTQDTSPMCNVGASVGRSDDDLFRTLGFEDGFATTSDSQPTFWVDFSDQGKGGSVDLFADFAQGTANNHGDSVGSGAIDLFASFNNANSAFDSGSFHANAPNETNPVIISNAIVPTGVAPSDEFASLNCGYDYESANVVGMSPLGVEFGFENVSNPLTAIVPTNELAGKDMFSPAPTFNATPRFASNQEQSNPFGSTPDAEPGSYWMGSGVQQNVVQQQEMWLQIQNKILTKHLT